LNTSRNPQKENITTFGISEKKDQSTNMWDLDSRKTASTNLNGELNELNDVFLMPLTLTLQNPVSHAESMVV